MTSSSEDLLILLSLILDFDLEGFNDMRTPGGREEVRLEEVPAVGGSSPTLSLGRQRVRLCHEFVLISPRISSSEHVVRDTVGAHRVFAELSGLRTRGHAIEEIHFFTRPAGLNAGGWADEVHGQAFFAHDPHMDRHGADYGTHPLYGLSKVAPLTGALAEELL